MKSFKVQGSRFQVAVKLLLPALITFQLSLSPSPAQDPAPISPEVKQSVDKAVAWLLTQQRKQGCFMASDTNVPVQTHSGALTALAIMGLASVGHMPGNPTPEGRALDKAMDFMINSIVPGKDGYLGLSDRSRMYGHGIMSLMFAEMLGQVPNEEQDKKIRERVKLSVEFIMRSQDVKKSEVNSGGWRYEPGSTDSDMSVSVWQVMTLRAAKNAGIEVPKSAIDKALAYIKRSYKDDKAGRGGRRSGGFGYTPGASATYSATAAGVLSLQVCGEYEAPEVIGGAEYLMRTPPARGNAHFYYGSYYYAQCMYQRGGEQASVARQNIEKVLLGLQQPTGAWPPEEAGPIYTTSLALLSLSVHHHFLPIYQK